MAARGAYALTLAACIAGLAALGAQGAAARGDVRRCEDSEGRITYSNESCPSGTARERPVEERPAVEVTRDPGSEKALHAGTLKRAASGEASAELHNPERAQEVAREQNKALVARCDDLVRRIEYSQQDLLSASGAERASIELGVRRLQQEHEATCVKH
jgi:hypothetical protein